MSVLSDISWPQYTEQNWAASDPDGHPDIMNEGYDILWEVFCVEHDKDGDHQTSGLTYAKVEEGSWSGNDADDRDISLTDGALDIKWLKIFGTDLTGPFAVTESFPADKTSENEIGGAFVADYIQSVGTGTFQVGTTANTSGETYYYIAIGE